jgi:hypothetical protein
MELFLLYVWMKLDGFIILMGCMAAFAAVLSLVTWGWAWESDWNDRVQKIARKRLKVTLPVLVITGLTAMLTPSQTQTAVLAGVWVGLAAAKSPEGEKALLLIRKKINQELDAALK